MTLQCPISCEIRMFPFQNSPHFKFWWQSATRHPVSVGRKCLQFWPTWLGEWWRIMQMKTHAVSSHRHDWSSGLVVPRPTPHPLTSMATSGSLLHAIVSAHIYTYLSLIVKVIMLFKTNNFLVDINNNDGGWSDLTGTPKTMWVLCNTRKKT
jgi:hypothetical protein